jgi:hypothetical protein
MIEAWFDYYVKRLNFMAADIIKDLYPGMYLIWQFRHELT